MYFHPPPIAHRQLPRTSKRLHCNYEKWSDGPLYSGTHIVDQQVNDRIEHWALGCSYTSYVLSHWPSVAFSTYAHYSEPPPHTVPQDEFYPTEIDSPPPPVTKQMPKRLDDAHQFNREKHQEWNEPLQLRAFLACFQKVADISDDLSFVFLTPHPASQSDLHFLQNPKPFTLFAILAHL